MYKAIVSRARLEDPFPEVGTENRFILKAKSLVALRKKTSNLFIGDLRKVRVEVYRESNFYTEKPQVTWTYTQES